MKPLRMLIRCQMLIRGLCKELVARTRPEVVKEVVKVRLKMMSEIQVLRTRYVPVTI